MKIFKKKSVSFVLAFAIMLSVMMTALVPAFMATNPFSDVPDGQWYTDNITIAYEDGVMTGTYHDPNTGKREFSPFSPLTVAEWTVMMVRAWYADELANSTVGKITWFNREAAILQSHGVYNGIGTNNDISFYTSASRNQMAVTIANLMKDKGMSVSAGDIASAKAKIPDLSSIPAAYQDSVAACYHLGILTGKSGGNFCGNDSMQRCEAATVYVRVKNVLNGKTASGTDPNPDVSNPVDPTPTPSTPVSSGSPVGTISSERVTINKNSIITHAPITDYWASQPMEIRNISDRDYFNAACQTIKDTELMTTQGSLLATGVNPYYNYVVVATNSAQTATNVTLAMGNLSAMGCTYLAGGNTGYVYRYARPLRTATTSAPRFASTIASLTPDMSDRAKAEACINAVCQQLEYDVNGTASWDNGGTKGFCETYMRMLSQILSAAGIPNICVTGTVTGGSHAWNIVYLKDSNGGTGSWYIMDGTCFESGYDAVLTFAQHESIFNYSHSLNDRDYIKVAKALVELFF